tara:strand:- start:6254 stop:6481 length:228 start_codon:yes stop_codon:yes gene_type:complete
MLNPLILLLKIFDSKITKIPHTIPEISANNPASLSTEKIRIIPSDTFNIARALQIPESLKPAQRTMILIHPSTDP